MPITPLSVVTIFPWPHFQTVIDGLPAIGAQLYTYDANTTTPKAVYHDPGLLTPHPNPVVLDDQGSADIYLNGFYHLRLHDEVGELYWEVDNYSFASGLIPSPDGFTRGSTDATMQAVPGAALLTLTGLAPLGYRVTGVTSTITTSFGTSGGLAALLLGDGVLEDRWGSPAFLTAGTQTGQKDFCSDTQPIAQVAYTLQVAALGGLFDATGALHVTVYWESLAADLP
jgi:hypothetical protein